MIGPVPWKPKFHLTLILPRVSKNIFVGYIQNMFKYYRGNKIEIMQWIMQ